MAGSEAHDSWLRWLCQTILCARTAKVFLAVAFMVHAAADGTGYHTAVVFDDLEYLSSKERRFSQMLLDKELCVITGAGSGIGRAIAERFISEGADVIVSVHDVKKGTSLYRDIPQVLDVVQADATKIEDIERIAASAAATGRCVKAVVPVVGNGPQNPIPKISVEEYRRVMDLNVFSAFFTVQKLLPYMTRGSSIVLISSIAGFQGGKNAIIYNAAKAAVRSLARSFTGELAEKGIRTNVISPGPTQTKAFDDFVRGDTEMYHSIVSQIPLGHIGQPAEIAAIALFLASDQASYVTGAEVIADGGFTNR